jgi:polyphosphate kinase
MANHILNRELSWLSFNARVLQEAQDSSVPLLERLRFLAIYSSNLDEFFRVRVASLRSLLRLRKKDRKDLLRDLGYSPDRLLREIHRQVHAQQELFGEVFRKQLLPSLAAEGIVLLNDQTVTAAQRSWLASYFEEAVRPHLHPMPLEADTPVPFLRNRVLYLVIELWPSGMRGWGGVPRYALLEIPTQILPRFITLPTEGTSRGVLFLDDVLRVNLPALFPHFDVGNAYAVKLSRDAELYLEDEFAGNLVEMIRQSLSKRETGLPTRFLYDQQAPYPAVSRLKQWLGLADEDLVAGGRYHNFSDFFAFPTFDRADLQHPPLPPLPHPALAHAPSLFAAIAGQDHLLHLPYQSFGEVLRFLHEAADDPQVTTLRITLYRVAADSQVAQALIRARAAGKQVTAFVEVKARFDEETNLEWAQRMEAAGVQVIYSLPGLKVHAKLLLVTRKEGQTERDYAYLSTGNFNEKTARLYADIGLFTADPRLTAEVRQVFALLAGEVPHPVFEHLLVAPHHLRRGFYRLIEAEMAQAQAGEKAEMLLKMNSLEDLKMVEQLYEASEAGVRTHIIIRGICCLQPGVPGRSTHITATSIVDRFLEHARVFRFHHGGQEHLYLASADWMGRNLSRRVEVAFPVYDPRLRQEINDFLAFQLADNTHARLLDARQANAYVPAHPAAPVRAQVDFYRYLQAKAGLGQEALEKQ